MSDAKWLQKQKVLERFAKIPEEMTKAADEALAKECDKLVAAMKANAPVSDGISDTPGELRDSITVKPNPDRPASYIISVEAKDAKGRFIGRWVEFGHKFKAGHEAKPQPFFYVTYRSLKKGIQNRVAAAARKVAKAMFPKV